MGQVTIREARVDEREALEALQRRASLNIEGDRESLLANPDAVQLPENLILAGRVHVAEENGVTLGFAATLPRADRDIELDGLFVEPANWRGGVGRALIEHCAEKARQAGARNLQVLGNPNAEGFYLACGFETLGTEPTRFGSGLRMAKSLKPVHAES